MAAPTTQTATLLCTEALRRSGVTDANRITAQLTRVETELLRDVLRDIFTWKGKEWKLLEFEDHVSLDNHVSQLALPVGLKKLLGLNLYLTLHAGTLQGGTDANTVTLAAAEDITEDAAKGKPLILLSGTYSGQRANITAYNETTKVADVSPDFGGTPSTDEYFIVEDEYPLNPTAREAISSMHGANPPTHYAIYDSPQSLRAMLYFNGAVESDEYSYCLRRRYSLDLDQVDLDPAVDPRIQRIYNKVRPAIIDGLVHRLWFDRDDDRADTQKARFDLAIKNAAIDDAQERVPRGTAQFAAHSGGMPVWD